jgi:hypothetical protein
LAKRHHDLLLRLEPVGLNRYRITETDIQTVEKYLSIIQKGLRGGSTWQEVVQYAGPYGTSIIIHEIIEIRGLESKGIEPLRLRTQALRDSVSRNIEAHIMATYEEHLYLQEVISRLWGQKFEVATLIKANRGDESDLELLLESDVGVYILEEQKVEEASQVLARLKGEIP